MEAKEQKERKGTKTLSIKRVEWGGDFLKVKREIEVTVGLLYSKGMDRKGREEEEGRRSREGEKSISVAIGFPKTTHELKV